LVLPTFLRAVVCLKKGLAVLGVFGTSLSTDSVSRTCLGASKYSRDCPLFLIPLLGPGPPATRLTSLSSCLLLPGLPSCSKSFISFPHPPGLIQMVRPLSKIGKLGVEYLERTVRPHACHTPKQKKKLIRTPKPVSHPDSLRHAQINVHSPTCANVFRDVACAGLRYGDARAAGRGL
jgi:hypothetical protein